ncbi:MAG: ABC transporter ATP-binding protein, partial [Clostridia bacterium]|nr:ABC transporter ATP-binding protein [Clostridia bacterium]
MSIPPIKKKLTDGIKKPKSLREVPRYLYLRIKGFLARLFYIISLVWRASPAVLISLCIFCMLDGILPVIGAYISSELLNGIASLIGIQSTGSLVRDLFELLSPVIFLFVLQLIHHFLKRLMTKLNSMVTSIAGELVVNYVKLMIIGKARTVDMRSYDTPEFYEKLENANREASMRPIGILTASFNVISSVISVISFIVVLATLSPIAPLVIVVCSIPGAFVNYYFKNKSYLYLRRHSKERRQMNYYSSILTSKDYAKEVKLQGLADTLTDKYNGAFKKYYLGLKRIITKEGLTQALVSLLTVLASTALFVYVAYTVVFGNGRIGDYSLYTGALTSIS